MTSWGSGYVLDIEYTSGFFRELSPAFIDFVALLMGVRPPPADQQRTYCEVACGQGYGANLIASANPDVEFHAFDFNPAQIVNARSLASQAGLRNISFSDMSFEQALKAPEAAMPQFDYIVLHGIYSWISPENRRFIVEFLDKRLKPGGLVYVSYNCMPGWASAVPLQRLIKEHSNRHPDRSDFQAQSAVKMAQEFLGANAAYFAQNPAVKERLDKLPEQNKQYLAHEYLNGHWNPMYHMDVAREFSDARLTYIGSANLCENIDQVSVPEKAINMIAASRDPLWQETLRDYARNQTFRRDIFARGASRLVPAEQGHRLSELRVALTVARSEATTKFKTPLGDAEGQTDIYHPILDALSERPHTIGELVKIPALKAHGGPKVLQALTLLVHSGQIHPAPNVGNAKAQMPGKAFNRAISERIQFADIAGYMALPAVGTGTRASYPDLLVLSALAKGVKPSVEALLDYSWPIMERTGQRLLKDGKPAESKEETIPLLREQLETVVSAKLSVWKSLGAV